MTLLGNDDGAQLGALPARLCDWRLSPGRDTFAYGGDEVDLSVWSIEQAFAPRSDSLASDSAEAKKRKRSDALFPGEIWRARNVRFNWADELLINPLIHI